MIGLINIQFAVYGDEELYVIEANPRASRTVPFVSKAIGVPLAKLACRLMLGERLADIDLDDTRAPRHVSVKEAVLPFGRFPRADALLGPEMKSTGEVMGVAADYPAAFGKAQAAAGAELPAGRHACSSASPTATSPPPPRSPPPSTTWASGCWPPAAPRRRSGAWACPVERIRKLSEGSPNVVDRIEAGERGPGDQHAHRLRRPRRRLGDPPRRGGPRACRASPRCRGASAAQRAIRASRSGEPQPVSLQELHGWESTSFDREHSSAH